MTSKGNLYDEETNWTMPEKGCKHGKQFYCQICYDELPDEAKKLMEQVVCPHQDT